MDGVHLHLRGQLYLGLNSCTEPKHPLPGTTILAEVSPCWQQSERANSWKYHLDPFILNYSCTVF